MKAEICLLFPLSTINAPSIDPKLINKQYTLAILFFLTNNYNFFLSYHTIHNKQILLIYILLNLAYLFLNYDIL